MESTSSAILVKVLQDIINAQNSSTITQWVSIVVLAITGFFVFKYTKATLELRDSAKEQIELSILPLLGFEFKKRSNDQLVMVIRNIGKGPALNVKIFPFLLEGEGKKFRSEFSIDGYNILHPDQERDLEETVYINDIEHNGHSLLPHLDPRYATKNYELRIIFDNSLGITYRTTIKTGKDGFSIIKPPRRI